MLPSPQLRRGSFCPVVRSPQHTISVVLVDPHTLFRQGLVEMLSGNSAFEVAGEGCELYELAALTARYKPDVLLFDVDCAADELAAALREVAQVSPDTRMLLLTMHTDPVALRSALDSGAHACVAKTVGRDELMATIWLVTRCVGYTLALLPTPATTGADTAATGLSGRELEVLQLLNLGNSNAQIARELHITESTVKRHLTKIYAKLHAVSRVDALNKAAAARLLTPAEHRPVIVPQAARVSA